MCLNMSVYGEIWLALLGILLSLLLRCIISLYPYSGMGIPPMFGDYEAQRHWMELTVNLPIKDWYRNTTTNDLNYWGIDYPPLTTYHMLLCGKISQYLDPNWVELFTSRGFESDLHKIFMRYTVLISDLLVYIPAVFLFYYINTCKKSDKKFSFSICIILNLCYPGLILIDHGHFQYNCVSLGFTVLSVCFITSNCHLLAAISFCLALNYKQMCLYYSIPYFLYLLSHCVPKYNENLQQSVWKFTKIAIVVLISFLLIWAPFLIENTTFDVLFRLFPLNRGIFESKVSNFWCFLNVFYKLKSNFTNIELARLCLISTLIAIIPSSIDLFLRPNKNKFVLSLINSSLAFFLFSFQVHEKSILLVSCIVLLHFREQHFSCFWFLIISNFSMLPLIQMDNLNIAFIGLNIFYFAAYRIAVQHTYKNSNNFKVLFKINLWDSSFKNILKHIVKHKNILQTLILNILFCISVLGCVIIYILLNFVKPPNHLPDLFSVISSVYCCIHFLLFFVYFNYCQFKIKQDYTTNVKFKVN